MRAAVDTASNASTHRAVASVRSQRRDARHNQGCHCTSLVANRNTMHQQAMCNVTAERGLLECIRKNWHWLDGVDDAAEQRERNAECAMPCPHNYNLRAVATTALHELLVQRPVGLLLLCIDVVKTACAKARRFCPKKCFRRRGRPHDPWPHTAVVTTQQGRRSLQ